MMSPTSLLLVSTSESVGKVVLRWSVGTLNDFFVCMGIGDLTMDKPLDIDPQGVFWTGDCVGLIGRMSQRSLST